MQRKEVISVCMATYNGEKYIYEQLISILSQLESHDEVIISDDGSSDATIDIIKSFNDERIVVFKNNFKNVVKNFEFAISQAKGEYLFLSDQDDIWEPSKISVCLHDFKKGFDLILSDCYIFNSETKKIVENSFFNFNRSKKGIVANIIKNSYIGCCMAFTKSVKEKVLPFPSNLPMHDSWIGILAEIYFKVNFNTEKLIKYRKHSTNASATGSNKSNYSFFKKIGFRVSLLYNITKKTINFGKH